MAAEVPDPSDIPSSPGIGAYLAMALPRTVAFPSLVLLCALGATVQAPDEGNSREQLQPLTKFRPRSAAPPELCKHIVLSTAALPGTGSSTGGPLPGIAMGRNKCATDVGT